MNANCSFMSYVAAKGIEIKNQKNYLHLYCPLAVTNVA